MRKLFTFLSFAIIIASCGAIGALPGFQGNASNATVAGKDEFIEMKDGAILEGKIDNLNWRGDVPLIHSSKFSVSGAPHNAKEINAFQSKNKYFRRTVYNDFAERIIAGKVNVYRLAKETGMNDKGRNYSYALYYLQKGEKGNLDEYDDKLMEKTIKDNPTALAKFNEYKSLSGSEKRKNGEIYLTEIIHIYNQ
jgi:hypothetical protein